MHKLPQTDQDLLLFHPIYRHNQRQNWADIDGAIGIAPFKEANELYGAFSNTTKIDPTNHAGSAYAITQQVTFSNNITKDYTWPSKENGYHAQKLISLHGYFIHRGQQNYANVVLLMLDELQRCPGQKDEFLPKRHNGQKDDNFSDFVDAYLLNLDCFANKNELEQACVTDAHNQTDWDRQLAFMRTVINLQMQQYPALKKTLIQFAKRGIIPVEVSRHDSKWASGPDGDGTNRLGVMLLELGNEYLRAQGGTPKVADPQEAYHKIKNQKQAPLAHDYALKFTKEAALRRHMNACGLLSNNQTPHHAQIETAVERAMHLIRGQFPSVFEITVAEHPMRPNAHVLKVNFRDPRDTTRFMTYAGGAPRCCTNMVSLDKEKANIVFTKLGEPKHGRRNPHDKFDAILYEAGIQQQTTASAQPGQQGPNQPPQPPHGGNPGQHQPQSGRHQQPQPQQHQPNQHGQPKQPQKGAGKHKVKTWDEIPTVGKVFLGILIALTFPISLPIFLGLRYAQKKAQLNQYQPLGADAGRPVQLASLRRDDFAPRANAVTDYAPSQQEVTPALSARI